MNKICLFLSSHLKYKLSRSIHMITNFTFYCRNLQIDRYRLLIGFNTQFHFLTNVKKDCNNWSALAALSRNEITFSFNKPLLGKKILIYSHAYYFLSQIVRGQKLRLSKKGKIVSNYVIRYQNSNYTSLTSSIFEQPSCCTYLLNDAKLFYSNC